MGLFVDLLQVPVGVTNDALEGIYKALSDGHDHDDGIWKPHESVLVRRLIELFTERGLLRIESVHKKYLRCLSGDFHKPINAHVTPPGSMYRWNGPELELVRLYLESLAPHLWGLDDHLLAVEHVVQTYLPADDLAQEADWLATKSALMGKVQANMDKSPTAKQADAILEALPSTAAEAAQQFVLSHAEGMALNFARVRAAESVRSLSEQVRHRMRTLVTTDLEQRMTGNLPPGTSSLQTKLMDEFGALNRDWRRIAITEAGEAQLQGFVASLKPGTKLKRVEQYKNACAFCTKIDGKIVTVVSADHPDKDDDTMIWPGKNNVGRSASPRKRVGDLLVQREPHEMWRIPSGLAHPNCRGRWVQVSSEPDDGDPAFAEWLKANLS